jgi:hypothetical protein
MPIAIAVIAEIASSPKSPKSPKSEKEAKSYCGSTRIKQRGLHRDGQNSWKMHFLCFLRSSAFQGFGLSFAFLRALCGLVFPDQCYPCKSVVRFLLIRDHPR